MIIEIKKYIEEVNELNNKAINDMFSEGYNEDNYAKEQELMSEKFNDLVNKYGMDIVLCELGFA